MGLGSGALFSRKPTRPSSVAPTLGDVEDGRRRLAISGDHEPKQRPFTQRHENVAEAGSATDRDGLRERNLGLRAAAQEERIDPLLRVRAVDVAGGDQVWPPASRADLGWA